VTFRRSAFRAAVLLALAAGAALAGAAGSLIATCGPFTDAAADAFCPFVLEIFYLGITTGTTPTTYDPTSTVSRLQMAAFLSRTVDGTLRRGSARAALDQFWTPKNAQVLGLTTVGTSPQLLASDGVDVWVACQVGLRPAAPEGEPTGSVVRVRASDGKLLENWFGANNAYGVLPAMGKIFATGTGSPGHVYRIDPAQPAGAVTTVATVGNNPLQLAFDGARIWTGNDLGSVSIVTPGATLPWTVTTVAAGFSAPRGILWDGANIWALDAGPNTLLKLDSTGAILQTVTVGEQPFFPVFDGSNIWAPSSIDNNVTVVRASTGVVLTVLTGNGLSFPISGAFDGQRVLIASNGNAVSVWKAADLTPLGSTPTGAASNPWGACSDGRNFWIALNGTRLLARF
jgi:hypothetical protein